MSNVLGSSYIVAGQTVTCRDRHGDWDGAVLQMDEKTGECVVKVSDPRSNGFREQGQRVWCSHRELGVRP